MKKLKYICLLCFFTITSSVSFAQDIHFSQFSMSPLNLNPAFTGFFDGDYRGAANYRSQWTTVPVSYSTVSLSADMRKDMKINQSDKVGLGLLFNNDVAGDSKYGTTQLYIPISYLHKVNADSNLFLNIGLQPGISNIGFKTGKLTYDNQWDGDAYNAALGSGENYSFQKRTYFDINTGMLIQYRLKQKSALTMALGLSHLNTPKISYYKNEDIQLDTKANVFLSFTYPLTELLNIKAEYLFEKQGKYKENVLGTSLSYSLSTNETQSINAGFYFRAKDAIIAKIGYDYKTWQFGISYDVNTSAFKVATNKRGAIEFGLIYIFQKPKLFVPKQRVCPIYM